MLVVLDTNVIVSGLISPYGAPARILDLVLSNAVRVAFDDRILAEYREVLMRPPFGFSARDVEALLDHVQMTGSLPILGPSPVRDCPDPNDLPFAEVALAAGADALVTGNRPHFRFLEELGVRVLSPSDFLASL